MDAGKISQSILVKKTSFEIIIYNLAKQLVLATGV
jgi:hypothetical protein